MFRTCKKKKEIKHKVLSPYKRKKDSYIEYESKKIFVKEEYL